MRARSLKRAQQMREYGKLVGPFLAGRSQCEFPAGCEARATAVHHRRGRFGLRLLDVDWWAASCDFHNDFAETRTGEALAIGWLIRIEGAA
jgi:hypothetical protein